MVLHIVVQDRRFNIIEGIGCMPTRHPSWLGVVHVSVIPFLIALVAAFYSCKNKIIIIYLLKANFLR